VFQRKRAAEAFAAKTVLEVSVGTHVPDAASVTVAEAGKLWVDTTELAGKERTTVEQYRQHVELHVNPLIGKEHQRPVSIDGFASVQRSPS
jgi:integrase